MNRCSIAFLTILSVLAGLNANSQCSPVSGNLVLNPGFESGTTNWSWSDATLLSSNGAIVCGTKSGDLQVHSSNAWAAQTVASDLPVGTGVHLNVYAGTDDNSFYHAVKISFYDASWNYLPQSVNVEVNKLLTAAPVGPQLYTLNAVVPSGAKYTQVGMSGDGAWLKTDNWSLTTSAPAGTCPGNLLTTNPGFESGLTGWNNWGNLSTSTSSYAGSFAGYVTGGSGGGSNSVPALPGVSYSLKGYARVSSGTGWAGLELHFYNSTWTEIGNATTQITSTTYQEYTVTATAPAGTAYVSAAIWKDATGSAWVDQLCLNSVATPCAGNLIYNQSFEYGFTQWNDHGNLQLTNDSYTGSYAAYVGAGSSGGGASETATAVPGQPYTLKVFAKVDNPALTWAVVELYFYDASWNTLHGVHKVVNSSNYQEYTLTGVAPAGAAMVRASFWKSGDGTLTTDDYCLTTGPASSSLAIGNRVFTDHNGNGIADSNDWGINDIKVVLYPDNDDNGVADGPAIDTTTTSGGGYYTISNLAAGKYFVQLENLHYSLFKSPVNGGDPDNDIEKDNNGMVQTGTSIKGGTITLSNGNEPAGVNFNSTYDFGLFKGNGLGDIVWADNNGNGLQDVGEAGIENVKIYLRDASNNAIIDSTVTNSSGAYYFYDPYALGTTNYHLQFVTPAGYTPSPSDAGSDDALDSDVSGGLISGLNVPMGIYNRTFDAGFVPLGSISNFVWNDINKNGLQDAGEPGLSGKNVTLKNGLGVTVATTTTDLNGEYIFNNLPAGNYQVQFSSISGMISTPANVGSNNAINSKANPATGLATLTLAIGENNTTLDAGFQNSGVLPVRTIHLAPVLQGNKVDLNWQTTNEINVSHFEVERSYGTGTFSSIGTVYTLVPQGGNGRYLLTDNSLSFATEIVSYRIKVVDIDGKVTYSNTAVVRLGKKTEISVWPNPFVSDIRIAHTANNPSVVSVSIITMDGRKIQSGQYNVARGNNQFTISNLDRLPAGNYIVELLDHNSQERFVQKIRK